MNVAALPRIYLSSGACESLKWLALLSMLVDHVNKALFESSLSWAIPVGRIAMPIFAMLVAYNCARPGADLGKSLRRLLAIGAIATPFHGVLFGGAWLPLNVLLTFAVAVAIMITFQRRIPLAGILLAVVAGVFVDYGWVGFSLVVTLWVFFRQPSTATALGAYLVFCCYCAFLGNAWSLLALPVIAAAVVCPPNVPRIRWIFWAFYPLHLAALWAIQVAQT